MNGSADLDSPLGNDFAPGGSMKLTFNGTVLGLTLGAFLLAGMPAVSYAGMIGTATALAAEAPAREASLARVRAGLARSDVREQLERFGVEPAAAAQRAAALGDTELARLADRLDTLPAGGDAGILEVIGLVFIVLLILDYVGVIHVFNTHHH
jgi:hypothetical protein